MSKELAHTIYMNGNYYHQWMGKDPLVDQSSHVTNYGDYYHINGGGFTKEHLLNNPQMWEPAFQQCRRCKLVSGTSPGMKYCGMNSDKSFDSHQWEFVIGMPNQ